jgi:pimeloyl-ACP methyl ester carboxylesterase
VNADSAKVSKRAVVSLLLVGLAVSSSLAAEGGKSAPNHPPGFVKPEPNEVIRLWPAAAPGLVPGGKPETFVNERYRNVSLPQLFVYLPAKEKARGTALIIAAGGGYTHLGMCLHVENVVKLLNDRGIAVFGLKYRTLYGNNNVAEDALADGKRAVRIVRFRAAQWGIDPHRIGVQGYSAGGHLALNLACRFDEGDPRASDPIERLSSRPDFVVLMCPWPYKQTLDDFPLGKRAPPAFIASAKDDKTAPYAFAAAIDQRLKGLGIRERLFAPVTGGHAAFHVGMVEGPGAQWPEALVRWLKETGMVP